MAGNMNNPITTNKDNQAPINRASSKDENLNQAPSGGKSSGIYRLVSLIGKNTLLVELPRADLVFKLGIMKIKNIPQCKFKLTRLESDYEIRELDIDFPNIQRPNARVLNSSSKFLLLAHFGEQQSECLYVYFNPQDETFIHFQRNQPVIIVTHRIFELKASYIDKNQHQAYIVLYDCWYENILVYKYKIENNICVSQTFDVLLSTVDIMHQKVNCFFTSKTNFLVAWNHERDRICYFDYESNIFKLHILNDKIISDVKTIPETDDIFVLCVGSLDYISVNNDNNNVRSDIYNFTLYTDIIILNNDFPFSFKIKRNFLFLFSSQSCKVYKLEKFNRLKKYKTLERHNFQFISNDITNSVYVTYDSKHLIFKCYKFPIFRYKLQYVQVNENDTSSIIPLNCPIFPISNDIFAKYITLDSSIIIFMNNDPYIINF